jgi:uncharacterized protein YneF (UPF0154 family)
MTEVPIWIQLVFFVLSLVIGYFILVIFAFRKMIKKEYEQLKKAAGKD